MKSTVNRFSLLLLTLFLIIATGCSGPFLPTKDSAKPSVTGTAKPGTTTTKNSQANVITFIVKVPPNTPPEDDIYLRLDWGKDIKMEKTGDLTWQADYKAEPGKTLGYGYHRNGVGYEASEEITPEDTESDWNRQRSTSVKMFEHKVQEDTITKWRWLLDEPPQAVISKETAEFLPRVDGWPFYKGIYVIDYWWDVFFTNGETEDTIACILKDGADLVQYSPTWAVKVTDDSIYLDDSIGYIYSEEAMRYETRAAKAAGLRVAYRNQVWVDLPWEEVLKERSGAWWEQYYRVRNEYLITMARIAEEEGVEAFCIGGESDSLTQFTSQGQAPAEAWTRWVEDIRQVRQIYKGLIYYDFLPPAEMGVAWEPEWTKWQPILDEIDFIGISWWRGVVENKDATFEELKAGVAGQFDLVLKPFFEKTGKPVMIIGLVFPSADGGSTGKYSWNARETDVWKPDDGTYNDFQEQADVFEAVMLAVAERPWIIGVYPFGFWRHDQQDKGPNIRGKPAEEVFIKWYGYINK